MAHLQPEAGAPVTDLIFVDEIPAARRTYTSGTKRPDGARLDGRPTLVTSNEGRHIAPDSARPHGTRAKYTIEKCRCLDCTVAQRIYNRDRHRSLSRPDDTWVAYVPAARARRHIAELRRQGIGLKTVAQLARVSHGTLSKLCYGDPTRGMKPSKRIRPSTERKILAVTADQAAGAQKIDAGPTWELLDDLLGQGFYKSWIAQQLGQKGPGLQLSRHLVAARNARAVERLHAEWSGKTPPAKRSRWQT